MGNVSTRGEGVKKRCQISILKIPLYKGTFLWGGGVKLIFPFSFHNKKGKRKWLMSWKLMLCLSICEEIWRGDQCRADLTKINGFKNKLKSSKVTKWMQYELRMMKDEWRMNEGWMKDDEGWRMMISNCWGVLIYDRRTYGHLWL